MAGAFGLPSLLVVRVRTNLTVQLRIRLISIHGPVGLEWKWVFQTQKDVFNKGSPRCLRSICCLHRVLRPLMDAVSLVVLVCGFSLKIIEGPPVDLVRFIYQ